MYTKRILCLIFLFFLIQPNCNATSIGFDQSQYDISPGESFAVDLMITGLGSMVAPSLSIYDMDIVFDPGILNMTNLAFGDPVLGDQLDLFGFGSIRSAFSTAGSINVFEFSLDSSFDLDSMQAGDFILLSMNFDAVDGGTSALRININALNDSVVDPIGSDVHNSSVVIGNTVPEPNSIFLMGFSLLFLAGINRKKWIAPQNHGE